MNLLTATALIGWLACSSLLAAQPATASTALFQAVRTGDRAAVQAHLKAGANVNARVDAGNTPLILAAFCANADVLRLLFQSGADVSSC